MADDWVVEDAFADQVEGKRVAVLCPLAPKPILLDVIQVDVSARMMKVKAVTGDGSEGREWWLSLDTVITVAVVPKDPPLVQPVPSGVILS